MEWRIEIDKIRIVHWLQGVLGYEYVSGTYCCDKSDAWCHYVRIGNSLRDALSLSKCANLEQALHDYKGTDRRYSHIQISSADALRI